ncbi:efflux RND transporter periplasmic adaptor subunit [bacterium]|nr:efflux RND transporter periplasmic adaptor subunit [bacterium]
MQKIHSTLITGLALLVLLPACNKGAKEAGHEAALPPAISAAMVTVQASRQTGYTELTGSVAGAQSVSLSTKLMSQITQLNVEVGQRVSAGEVLVRIDDSDILAMRNEAAAYRAEAAAALAEVETVVAQGRAGKAQAEAAVAQAEAGVEDARRDLERITRLVEEDTLPRVQKEKAELGLRMAEENLSKAHSAVSQAEAAIEQARSKTPQVEAKKLQASAKDQQAAAMQEYSVLRAPFDGVVTRKNFEPGQLAIPGQPILSIDALGGFKVLLGIPEHLAGGLKLGDSLAVMLEEGGGIGRELGGTLSVLGAAADPASHLVSAEVSLEQAQGLRSGQFARVRIPSGERSMLLVPVAAVQQEGELNYVWRVSAAGIVSRASIETGEQQDGQLEVLRGLSSGDRVLSEVPPGIYSGARIAGAETGDGAAAGTQHSEGGQP